MNTLYKPCGKKMTVNDNSLEYALRLGWTKKDPTKKKPTKQAE